MTVCVAKAAGIASCAGIVHPRLMMNRETLRFLAQDRPIFFDSILTACAGALLGWLPCLIAGLIVGIMADRGLFRSAFQAAAFLLLGFLSRRFGWPSRGERQA